VTLGIVILLSGSGWFFVSLNQPPVDFPVNQPVTVSPGTGVRGVTKLLAEANVVKSDFLLYLMLVSLYDPTDVKASTYVFDAELTTSEVAERLTKGDFDTDLIRFTHYEGERVSKIAERASGLLPNFNAEQFIAAAVPLEGQLFPETYFVPSTIDETDLLSLMTTTFAEKFVPLQAAVSSSTLSEDEIIILASIIEREANSPESKRMVSGILQNRLAIDMPLQADASIEYALDKPLAELTPEDLELDTPYNTYFYKGLPPTPIGNPGLDAIIAVLEPTTSEFLYYITAPDGQFYYAKSYAEHQKNIAKYLRP